MVTDIVRQLSWQRKCAKNAQRPTRFHRSPPETPSIFHAACYASPKCQKPAENAPQTLQKPRTDVLTPRQHAL